MADWLCGKSPKMWVNELCVKQLVRPEWTTREAHPGIQPPTFICTCTIKYTDNILTAEATGKTKKDAEQEAALIMLKDKLQMTPARLMAISSNKKKSDSASSTHSSTRGDSADGGRGVEGEVSDTDDKELAEASAEFNPISELGAICEQQEFPEPEYQEVGDEGPPHKKIFTVRCTVKFPESTISYTGRRSTKKVAKRLAFFRVLREVKKFGYKYTPHVGEDDSPTNSSASTVDDELAKLAIDIRTRSVSMKNDIASIIDTTMINGETSVRDIEKYFSPGDRKYCTDKTGKCMQYCTNYSHAYQHLPQSETLDLLLSIPPSDTYLEHGGPILLLQKITKEIGMRLHLSGKPLKTEPPLVVVFLEMKFPFDFGEKHLVPSKVVVHSTGQDSADAKQNVAKAALQLLRNFCSSN